MNNDVNEKYWKDYCDLIKKYDIKYKEAFQFGVDPDWLGNLVVEGKKVATSSGFKFYEISNEEIPKVNDYSIVLNSVDMPVAIIKVTKVEVVPFNKVSEEFALSEGEGDYNYWWNAHDKFYKQSCKEYNIEYKEDMLVVCETFEKVYPV